MVTRHTIASRRSWHFLVSTGVLLALLVLLVGCSNNPAQPSTNGQGTNNNTTTAQGGTTTSATSTPLPPLGKRALQLPTVQPGNSCPVTASKANVSPDYKAAYGNGPVYVMSGTSDGMFQYSSAPFNGDTNNWGGVLVTWQIAQSYTGTVLIRGRQIDGNSPVMFNGGVTEKATNPSGTEPMLETLTLKGGLPGESWSTWRTYTRLKTAGCYAYQIDGANFSYTVVFEAKAQ